MPAAAEPTGVITICGVLLNFVVKLIVAKQPGPGLPPVLIVTEPALSEPLTDTVPPLPRAVPLMRPGVLPPADKWCVTIRSPLSCSEPTLSEGADNAPRNVPPPFTLRFFCTFNCPCTEPLPVSASDFVICTSSNAL